MDKRSPVESAGEWRKQGFSGQVPCRTPIGAACRGGACKSDGNFAAVSKGAAGRLGQKSAPTPDAHRAIDRPPLAPNRNIPAAAQGANPQAEKRSYPENCRFCPPA